MRLALRDVEVGSIRRTVVVTNGTVSDIVPPTTSVTVDHQIDGRGGALLPGLHDHHIHLFASAAARTSVDGAGTGPQDFAAALRRAPGEWVRAINHDESCHGRLDRHVLDEWVADRPVRVQHRSGALWVLNTMALERVSQVLDDSGDVERDPRGVPNGRLWRYDARLRPALKNTELSQHLGTLGRDLLRYGLTGVTDATVQMDADAIATIRSAQRSGSLPVRVVLLGTDAPITEDQLHTGPRKVVIRDHDLPDVEHLAAQVQTWHAVGRPVALHTVSAEALVLVLAALDAVGSLPGDRIEHASVVPAGLEGWLRASGVVIVTQPDFVRARGDAYLRDVPADERPWLYRYRTLLDAGIPVVASSDAPYGSADPWQVMRSARDRLTTSGATIGADERMATADVLASYLRPADALTDAVRSVRPGMAADLCLLHSPLAEALIDPSADRVRLVLRSVEGTTHVHGL